MKNTVIYPGTFDPMTLGHVDLIERATRIFDRIIVGVANNECKQSLFSFEERIALAEELFKANEQVIIKGFEGLLVDFATSENVHIVLRGIRVVSDFDYEFQMASMNRTLDSKLETVFLTPSDQYTYLSSSLVRVVAKQGGNLSKFVPEKVIVQIKQKVGR